MEELKPLMDKWRLGNCARAVSPEPTQMELAEAIKQAKKEAAEETILEESVMFNPKLFENLRKTLLEDFHG